MKKWETAPDFAPGYPSKGERIGPGWEWAWEKLEGGTEYRRSQFAAIMSGATGLAMRTCENLLIQAGKVGVIETRKAGNGRYARVYIRRAVS